MSKFTERCTILSTNDTIIKEIETVYQIDDWIKDMQKKKGGVDEDDISGTGEIIKLFKKKAGVLVCGVKITSKFTHTEKCILEEKIKLYTRLPFKVWNRTTKK